jgi:hypothetical protein
MRLKSQVGMPQLYPEADSACLRWLHGLSSPATTEEKNTQIRRSSPVAATAKSTFVSKGLEKKTSGILWRVLKQLRAPSKVHGNTPWVTLWPQGSPYLGGHAKLTKALQ